MSGVTAVIDMIDRVSSNVTDVAEWPVGRIAPTVAHCASAAPAGRRKNHTKMAPVLPVIDVSGVR
jgi:hypothetical protein